MVRRHLYIETDPRMFTRLTGSSPSISLKSCLGVMLGRGMGVNEMLEDAGDPKSLIWDDRTLSSSLRCCEEKKMLANNNVSHWWQLMELLSWYPIFKSSHCNLTHWGRDKKAAILQTTLSNAFSWMKMLEFQLKFHWSLAPRVQLTIFQHWFR